MKKDLDPLEKIKKKKMATAIPLEVDKLMGKDSILGEDDETQGLTEKFIRNHFYGKVDNNVNT